MRLQTLIPLLPPPCLLPTGKAAFYFYGLEMIIGLTTAAASENVCNALL